MSSARMMPIKMPAFQRELCWAVLAAAALHGAMWLLLQQGGLIGRRDGETASSVASRADSTQADEHQRAASINIRVADRSATSSRPRVEIDGADHAQPVASGASLPDAALLPSTAQSSIAAGAAHLLPAVYWSSESLQSSPRPQAGWVLDEEVLDGVRQARVLLQVWVSALGQIDQVRILKAEPPGEWAHRALAHVSETIMSPGMKDGRAVPATVVVEIVADVERFR